MKALLFALFAIFATSYAKPTLGPSCVDDELNNLWPDYFDNKGFYKCISYGVTMYEKCESGKWFSFEHQSCVHPSEWVGPPAPVPRIPSQIAPLSMSSDNFEKFSLLFLTKGSGYPSEPPYPPATSKYPTPPTPVPNLPPTPKPTVPPLASSTFPPKPPTPRPTPPKIINQ